MSTSLWVVLRGVKLECISEMMCLLVILAGYENKHVTNQNTVSVGCLY